ncbi:MAG: zinc metallopeptidase [Bacteroidales bacterium]|nr:zinc metallopeptidase [Bacteroidales bacterium]MDD2823647.1 zinc metallopeptidase [Bacteroidales bacterium]MDD3099748.1 zinc metallopeptidase [Bacteroidales bacterium]MDD3638521.1 zinc metallopeptidase [Bacteroidales bacterium]MDD3943381.1 zinc metallopeptidase [Bacteroidales bacterium]
METSSPVSFYWIIFIGTVILSWIVQSLLQSKYKKYSRIRISSGLTGADVARKMLLENGIADVQVTSVRGKLTDHYNPVSRTVNLSEGVYAGNSIMAAAVAAHECGHALQHAKGYAPLKMRSTLVPVVSFASQWVMWVILAGLLVVNTFPHLMLLGIILFALTTLFSLITLPVEINASSRALAWLNETGITNYETHPMARDALKSAAYTYIVAAISSLATLFYYITLFTRRH